MNKFNIGNRVKVIKEPCFVTMYPNDVWEMHPQEAEDSMWGRANLQHLIGEEGVIDNYFPLLIDPTRDNDGGWYDVKFDKDDVAVPRGLQGFTKDEIELV